MRMKEGMSPQANTRQLHQPIGQFNLYTDPFQFLQLFFGGRIFVRFRTGAAGIGVRGV